MRLLGEPTKKTEQGCYYSNFFQLLNLEQIHSPDKFRIQIMNSDILYS